MHYSRHSPPNYASNSLSPPSLPAQLASSCACEWHFMFIVHCVLCSCLCENAHLHLVERGKLGVGTAGGRRGGSQPCCNADLFWRCTSCSFFAPTNDLPCLHHQRRTVAFSLLLCAFLPSYPLLSIYLPLHYPHRLPLAGELIITYHSWRTYPKSKHLTLLIRLMPWGARALAPASCTVPLPSTCSCLCTCPSYVLDMGLQSVQRI